MADSQSVMFTRDLQDLRDQGSGGPLLRAHEMPGQDQRPAFSPVAQPGMAEEIHWGTVKTGSRGLDYTDPGTHTRPVRHTRGMIPRLHEGRGGGGG